MKAFDAYLDRQSRDGGLDQRAMQSPFAGMLSREANAFTSDFVERQKLTVAANYFALACPIMPVGLLGVFFILGKLDTMYIDKEFKTDAHELANQRREEAQNMYLMAMKQKADREKEKKTSLACSRPLDMMTRPTDKTKKPKDAELKLEGKRSERISGPNLLSRMQNDTGKLIKQKMALQEHLERLSGEGDYHLYCRLSSQLELLDKALKKLGS